MANQYTTDNPLAPYKGNTQPLLDMLNAGKTTTQIAHDHGVTRYAVNSFLLNNCEKEWKEFQVTQALTDLEEAEEELRACSDALSLARVREQVRAAQWRLERVFQRIYGTKPDAAQGLTIQVIINDPLQAGSVTIEQEKDPI